MSGPGGESVFREIGDIARQYTSGRTPVGVFDEGIRMATSDLNIVLAHSFRRGNPEMDQVRERIRDPMREALRDAVVRVRREANDTRFQDGDAVRRRIFEVAEGLMRERGRYPQLSLQDREHAVRLFNTGCEFADTWRASRPRTQ